MKMKFNSKRRYNKAVKRVVKIMRTKSDAVLNELLGDDTPAPFRIAAFTILLERNAKGRNGAPDKLQFYKAAIQ